MIPQAAEPVAASSAVGGNALGMFAHRILLVYLRDGRPVLRVFDARRPLPGGAGAPRRRADLGRFSGSGRSSGGSRGLLPIPGPHPRQHDLPAESRDEHDLGLFPERIGRAERRDRRRAGVLPRRGRNAHSHVPGPSQGLRARRPPARLHVRLRRFRMGLVSLVSALRPELAGPRRRLRAAGDPRRRRIRRGVASRRSWPRQADGDRRLSRGRRMAGRESATRRPGSSSPTAGARAAASPRRRSCSVRSSSGPP